MINLKANQVHDEASLHLESVRVKNLSALLRTEIRLKEILRDQSAVVKTANRGHKQYGDTVMHADPDTSALEGIGST